MYTIITHTLIINNCDEHKCHVRHQESCILLLIITFYEQTPLKNAIYIKKIFTTIIWLLFSQIEYVFEKCIYQLIFNSTLIVIYVFKYLLLNIYPIKNCYYCKIKLHQRNKMSVRDRSSNFFKCCSWTLCLIRYIKCMKF